MNDDAGRPGSDPGEHGTGLPPDQRTEHTVGSDPRWRLTPTKIVVTLVLLVGIVVPLLVGTYARVEPRLFGFPFFYWYQLLWVFLAAAICGIAFWLLKREQDARERAADGPGPTAPRRGATR